MVEQLDEHELSNSLFRIASNPAMVGALHEIMGGFCHQCRNILNSLKLSLYLANRDASAAAIPIWSELEQRYRTVEQLFDRLQMVCRPMTLTTIRAPLGLVMEERRDCWTEAMEARGSSLVFEPPRELDLADFDPVRLPEALDVFVCWRAAAGEAGGSATLRWGVTDGLCEICWDEPTAVSLEDSEELRQGPDTLALPLLARVISAHGGALNLEMSDGLHLGASWPLVDRSL